ncbi:YcaO-like family protein [Anabaena sp. UHCC 0399]|uniref:YcaO-like family protein n=1 Tax=Anabaena sp. UHCC 0399 TaxID=3110238 RepID=UPI002B20C37D|nr:YcaO-like family protein [Anabaena sp. UHCC 0399]MEA5568310.1 YcaO-like family protein [Anabaena sp. UHCC 0399]
MNAVVTSSRWRDLVSPHTGIIRAMERISKPYTECELPVIWQAELAHYQIRKRLENLRFGIGKGMTDEQAILGAVGEALERYCGGIVDRRRMVVSSFAKLDNRALPPPTFYSFSEQQYSDPNFLFPAFDSTMQTSWIAAQVLGSNDQVFVPMSLTYLDWCGEQPGDDIVPASSNGMATGSSVEFAAYSGLCELIERDAFIITWLNRLPAPRINFEHQPGILREIARNYARFDIELMAFDFTTDIRVPVVVAIAIDHSDQGPAVVTGLGCHLDGQTALRKAIFEVCQARPGDLERIAHGAGANLHKYEDIQNMDDHSAFFYTTARLGELDFLLNHDQSLKVEDLPTYTSQSEVEKLQTVLTRLNSVGVEAYLVDITTSDIASVGFRVVRTLATELVPIYFGIGQEPLGSQRLFEVPERLGYGGRRTAADLNPCPHPIA